MSTRQPVEPPRKLISGWCATRKCKPVKNETNGCHWPGCEHECHDEKESEE